MMKCVEYKDTTSENFWGGKILFAGEPPVDTVTGKKRFAVVEIVLKVEVMLQVEHYLKWK